MQSNDMIYCDVSIAFNLLDIYFYNSINDINE